MRGIVATMLVMAGIGLLVTSSARAEPINGATIDRAATAASMLSQIRYYRWHGRVCYSKCYREFVIGRRVCRRFC